MSATISLFIACTLIVPPMLAIQRRWPGHCHPDWRLV